MTPEQKQRMDEAREAIIEIVASALSDNDVKPRADEILNLKDSEGNRLIAVLDKDQEAQVINDSGGTPLVWASAQKDKMIKDNFRRVIIGGEE